MPNVLDHGTMRTLGNIHVESSQGKIGLYVSRFSLDEARHASVEERLG